ncbi:50S ribosomal protein L16 [Mycoplasma sp. SG1]|uniref:50S ribosomal protein L16 n=1 Tax=Mycoplasma sp. SG1 TaxID=2810348 RepID=UPI002023D508|nr:50S ribosomal protein L16 [Mycoplasma sp. SG1]URM52898.1 50S ribosomal protein L16 [Mycoplasma sp. SG1]
MLMPKKTKWAKPHNVKYEKPASSCNTVVFGEWGLQAVDGGWITNNQIEASRVAMSRLIRKGGKLWIRIFPHMSKTKKPLEVRMGSGKGSPALWVAPVRPGTVMFEITANSDEQAKYALSIVNHKLPIKCKIIKKADSNLKSNQLT